MALVSYSESESESEAPPPKQPPAPHPPSKKPFQKVVDRSNGKIIVNLGQPSTSTTPSDDQPPAKRARTADTSVAGGLFKGFNSFLPPPKNRPRAAPIKPSAAPGIHLKTSAEVGFARSDPDPHAGPEPPAARPAVSEDLKPAEDVKLVGKPLMFKPLSVARGSTKKKPRPSPTTKTTITTTAATPDTTSTSTSAAPGTSSPNSPAAAPAAPRKSLFSLHVEEQPDPDPEIPYPNDPWTAQAQAQFPISSPSSHLPPPAAAAAAAAASSTAPPSLRTAADDLNLSPAARRELFGRAGARRDSSILTLDMDTEYRHNEQLRAAGDTQLHNPVRAIQGGGKHSLRQLVHNVVNQREALEDSFAKGKSNRKEASNKYGW